MPQYCGNSFEVSYFVISSIHIVEAEEHPFSALSSWFSSATLSHSGNKLTHSNFCPRSCTCKIISRIERLQALMLSGNQCSVAQCSLLWPLVYSDNQNHNLPSNNWQTLFSVQSVILLQIMQTWAQTMLSVGLGKIQHNQWGGFSTFNQTSQQPAASVFGAFGQPQQQPQQQQPQQQLSNSRVLVCLGALVHLGLKLSPQVDSVSYVLLLVRLTYSWFRDRQLWGCPQHWIYQFVWTDQHFPAASCSH
jgi:hypothetical protein